MVVDSQEVLVGQLESQEDHHPDQVGVVGLGLVVLPNHQGQGHIVYLQRQTFRNAFLLGHVYLVEVGQRVLPDGPLEEVLLILLHFELAG